MTSFAFETMYPDLAVQGIALTAIGVVTSDPVSVESVLAWAARLQNRVDYVIVENATTLKADFSYWRDSQQSRLFHKAFRPAVLSMEYRVSEFENGSPGLFGGDC